MSFWKVKICIHVHHIQTHSLPQVAHCLFAHKMLGITSLEMYNGYQYIADASSPIVLEIGGILLAVSCHQLYEKKPLFSSVTWSHFRSNIYAYKCFRRALIYQPSPPLSLSYSKISTEQQMALADHLLCLKWKHHWEGLSILWLKTSVIFPASYEFKHSFKAAF